jgi:hypothetical protein
MFKRIIEVKKLYKYAVDAACAFLQDGDVGWMGGVCFLGASVQVDMV